MLFAPPFIGASIVPIAAIAGSVAASGAHVAGPRLDIPLVRGRGDAPEDFLQARTGQGAPSRWQVLQAAPVNGNTLVQTAADPTDNRFPLAIYEKFSAADLDVSVRFKAVDGRVDRAGGIAIRLLDAGNYYVVRANALEDNVNFYHVRKGVRREIAGATVKVPSLVWHTLGLRAEGDRFAISFNGAVLFQATDRTFPGAGKIALWTKADSLTEFAGFSVTSPP